MKLYKDSGWESNQRPLVERGLEVAIFRNLSGLTVLKCTSF